MNNHLLDIHTAERNMSASYEMYTNTLSILDKLNLSSEQQMILANLEIDITALKNNNTTMINSLYSELGISGETYDTSVEGISEVVSKSVDRIIKLFKKIYKSVMKFIRKVFTYITGNNKSTKEDSLKLLKSVNNLRADSEFTDAHTQYIAAMNGGVATEDIGGDYIAVLCKVYGISAKELISRLTTKNEVDIIKIAKYNYPFIKSNNGINKDTIGLLGAIYKDKLFNIIKILEFIGTSYYEINDSIDKHELVDLSVMSKKLNDLRVNDTGVYRLPRYSKDLKYVPVYLSGVNPCNIHIFNYKNSNIITGTREMSVVPDNELYNKDILNSIKYLSPIELVDSGIVNQIGEIEKYGEHMSDGVDKLTKLHDDLLNKKLTKLQVSVDYRTYGMYEKLGITSDDYINSYLDAATKLLKIATDYIAEYRILSTELTRIYDILVPVKY